MIEAPKIDGSVTLTGLGWSDHRTIDLADDVVEYRRRAQRLSPLVSVVDLDARDTDDIERLAPWTGPGQTLALVGSSGVGKSTLLNGLTSTATGGVRTTDGTGRHTTTARSLRQATAGGWVVDTLDSMLFDVGRGDESLDAERSFHRRIEVGDWP